MPGSVWSVTKQLQPPGSEPAASDQVGAGRGVARPGEEDQEVQQGEDPDHDPGQRGVRQGCGASSSYREM